MKRKLSTVNCPDSPTSFPLGFHVVDYWNLEEPRKPDFHGNYEYVTKEYGSFAVLSISFFSPQGQVMYASGIDYVMTQYPGGVPMAVPMQADAGMVPIQTVTPVPQGDQPQMVVVPAPGMVGNQPQFAQIASAGAIATGYQPQFAQVSTSGAMAIAYQPQVPPTYYTKMENDEA